MNLTTIQLRTDTKKKLEQKKLHPRESYDQVIRRVLEEDETPSMEEMFRLADTLPQKRRYTTKEIVNLSHEWRKGCRIS